MEYAVAFMAGVSYVVLGASLFLRWQDWSYWLKEMRKHGRTAALGIGAMHLAIGTFIVGFHWKWEGFPLLLSVLGVKAIAEGVVYTLFPNVMLAMLTWFEPHHRALLRISGVVTVIIALLVGYEWWEHMQNTCLWQPCFNQASSAF